jgi:hypothetical protein
MRGGLVAASLVLHCPPGVALLPGAICRVDERPGITHSNQRDEAVDGRTAANPEELPRVAVGVVKLKFVPPEAKARGYATNADSDAFRQSEYSLEGACLHVADELGERHTQPNDVLVADAVRDRHSPVRDPNAPTLRPTLLRRIRRMTDLDQAADRR